MAVAHESVRRHTELRAGIAFTPSTLAGYPLVAWQTGKEALALGLFSRLFGGKKPSPDSEPVIYKDSAIIPEPTAPSRFPLQRRSR
jgi:hypothetical protein